jgi:hypothetical protein
MKPLFAMLAMILSMNAAVAGPSVTGGVPPHPALTQMALVEPEAGVDYPTETANAPAAVLALYSDRISIYGVEPRLVVAEAGIDFPTDVQTPIWAQLQMVLLLGDVRLPVKLSYPGDELKWEIKGEVIEVAHILSIRRAEAGIDFPTDGPPWMQRPSFIISLIDGSQIALP